MTSGAPARMAAWLESAWLARYLERQLDGEELAWFEAYLLDKPELLGMVEADNALRDGLAADVGILTLQARAIAHSPYENPGWLVRLSAVGVLFVAFGIGWLAMSLRRNELSPAIVANPTRIVFDTMRGEQTEQHVDHAEGSSPYVLVEIAVPPGAEEISMSLADEPLMPLKASSDGFASFLIRRSAMQSGPRLQIFYRSTGKNFTKDITLTDLKEKER